jgi:hypothetical protein
LVASEQFIAANIAAHERGSPRKSLVCCANFERCSLHPAEDIMRPVALVLLGLTLAAGTTGIAQAQAPDWQQAVGGLLNGNHDREDAVRQAYERGYQRGRDDEARMSRGRALREDQYDRGGYRR